jgi:hypothetical protein
MSRPADYVEYVECVWPSTWVGRSRYADGSLVWPTFTKAVLAGSWTLAAQHCHRVGLGDRRNRGTAVLFEAAVRG